MKDKRIWVVIGCIMVIGTGVTHYTEYYVKSQSTVTMDAEAPTGDTPAPDLAHESQDGAENGEPAAPYAAPRGRSRGAAAPLPADGGPGSQPSAVAEGAGDTIEPEHPSAPETAVEEETGQAAQEPDTPEKPLPMSPLTGARALGGKPGSAVDYRQRLMDLDAQIQRMREQDTDSNVYSLRTSADTELKMWESEMNAIYNALLAVLPEEDAAKLASEQQDWIKNRDGNAAESSGRNSASVESIGYAATLVSLTRERAYELAGWYEEAMGVKTQTDEGPSVTQY